MFDHPDMMRQFAQARIVSRHRTVRTRRLIREQRRNHAALLPRRASPFPRIVAAAATVALLTVLTPPPADASPAVVTAWSWGNNTTGQLGDGTTTSRTAPADVPGMGDVTAVDAGDRHSLAVRSVDGTVWAWGSNRAGQLGDGTTNDRPAAVKVDTTTGSSGMVAVAAGGDHSLALRGDGRVFAWGSNESGQLGDVAYLVGRPVLVRGLPRATAIAAGARHSLALHDGTVWAWGDNTQGQLGDGTTVNRDRPVTVPGLSEVVAIAAGDTHSLALRDDGTVLAWGANEFGQLGDGTTTSRLNPKPIENWSEVAAITAGGGHSLAVDAGGGVWAWGRNDHGQLGDGTTATRLDPTPIGNDAGVATIAAGGQHSVAMLRDGTGLLAWGANADGQLGDGTTEDRHAPVEVTASGEGTAVAAGDTHSVALQSGPPTRPGRPTQVQATPGDASARVKWTAPPDGGSPITGYTVSVGGQVARTVDKDVTSTEITGLTNGQSYTFTVNATNQAGDGLASSSDPVTPFRATAPDAPTLVRAVAGDGSAFVWWTAPRDDNRSPITGYIVTVWSGGQIIDVKDQMDPTTTRMTLSGLTNGTTYQVTVAAVNAAGVGASSDGSNPFTPTPPPTVPGAPRSVTATAGVESATITWSEPASDGGAPISLYTVVVSDGRSIQVQDGTATSRKVTGLVAGRTYTFTVTATNTLGSGPVSAPSEPVTPTPRAVTGLSLTVGYDQITTASPKPRVELKWTTQGVPDAIEVSWSDGSTSRTVTLNPAPASYTVTGLIQGNGYTFRVRAVAGGVKSTPASLSTSGSVVTSAVGATVVTSGASSTMSGKLTRAGTSTSPGNQAVQLQIRTQTASSTWSGWSNVGSPVRTSSTGSYAIVHRTPRNAQYRVVFAGAVSHLGSISPVRAVDVAPKVTATLSTTTMRLGSSARLSGTVSPNLAGRTVQLQRKVDGQWVHVRSQKLSPSSTYSVAIKPGTKGTHTYRVRLPASAPYAQGLSSSRSLKVT